MKKIFSLLCAACTVAAFANVDNIDIAKVTKDKTLLDAFSYIRENQKYYDHWEPEWGHSISKADLINKLEGLYNSFNAIKQKNTELHLLLGDISHFLYNLEAEKYNAYAVENYNAALALSPKDYRAEWFLANHYAYSAKPQPSVEHYLRAEAMLPAKPSADFWEEYAYAMHLANMPTHTLRALDKYREIKGHASNFEELLGNNVQSRIKLLNPEGDYKSEELWRGTENGKMYTFLSRPLGMSVAIDTTWNLQVGDYTKRKSSFMVFPPKLSNKAGREISYTILMLMNAAGKNDKLDDFVNIFADSYKDTRKRINFGGKYNNAIAYEVKDPGMYEDMGGAHLYIIGIETKSPEYPGLIFEIPASFPDPESEEAGLQYLDADDSKDRISDRMFYVFLLDTCEDIHDKCLPVFKNFLEKDVVLEGTN